ncbi:hypothetical protein [Methylobacterium oxalidis]|uniref:Holin of 3TMs, for gene-transfer release n=1 Tax=Methylobacterium oxalidis TaxID=944322 RepID=A0A512J6J3_9HYPH|nr:hypothetical protein [Methylobacterium oxalidis]GEP05577.1 hypothetical protein MOX02_36150 [Methylobacterium oxalidis]GJE32696.1 hypothetical protein LDDCCGHA_2884 [Methylobacterium oxalidis]GLS65442.1 hypothetical protein GCM10007888_38240 [Methylobacterium oxalidis]
MDWSQLAGQLAQIGLPALGTLFGGPLGGTVGAVVGKGVAAALGVPATPEAVSQAVAADPTGSAVKLAEIEAETKRQDAYLADLADARNMQIALVQTHSWVQNMPAIVTLLIFSAWIVLSVALYFVQAEIPERVYQLLSQAYGAANLALGTAIAFWLGSSRSSQVKDSQITALLPAATRR